MLIRQVLDEDYSKFSVGESQGFLIVGKSLINEMKHNVTLLQLFDHRVCHKKSDIRHKRILLYDSLLDSIKIFPTVFSSGCRLGFGRSSMIFVCLNSFTYLIGKRNTESRRMEFKRYFFKKCRIATLLSDGTIVCLSEEGRLEVYRDTYDAQIECIFKSEKKYDFVGIQDIKSGRFATIAIDGHGYPNKLTVQIWEIAVEAEDLREHWIYHL